MGSMTRTILLTTLASAVVAATVAGQTPAADLKRQVFAAESSFAASMAERNLAAFASHVSPEAVFFGDTTVMRGKEEVLARWRGFFTDANAPFSWKPEVIEVLSSGRLALSSGPVFDAKGKKLGSFNSIWRRDQDGRWKIIFDKGCQ
jgi:ketosteroid isomerase-like protein